MTTNDAFPITIYPKQVREIKALCSSVMALCEAYQRSEGMPHIAGRLQGISSEAATVLQSINAFEGAAIDIAKEGLDCEDTFKADFSAY